MLGPGEPLGGRWQNVGVGVEVAVVIERGPGSQGGCLGCPWMRPAPSCLLRHLLRQRLRRSGRLRRPGGLSAPGGVATGGE